MEGDEVVDSGESVPGHSTAVERPIIENLTKNADVVAIDTMTDISDPGKDRVMIIDTLALNYNKFETYKLNEEDTTMVTFYTDLPKGGKVAFRDSRDEVKKGWSGNGIDGKEMENRDYLVKLPTTVDKSFTNR